MFSTHELMNRYHVFIGYEYFNFMSTTNLDFDRANKEEARY